MTFFIPNTKSFRFGTCGNTLKAISIFALIPESVIFFTLSEPKKSTIVGIPLFSAIFATFAAGSIPKTGICLFLKFYSFSKYKNAFTKQTQPFITQSKF